MRRQILIALAFAGALLGSAGAAVADGRHGGHGVNGLVLVPGRITIQIGNPHQHRGYGYRSGYNHRGYGYGHRGGYAYYGRPKRYGPPPRPPRQAYQVQQCYEVPAQGYGGHRIVCPGGYAYKPYKRVPPQHANRPRHYSWR